MNNRIERQEAFQQDFDALLEKHGAEVCIAEDDGNCTCYHPRYVIEVHQKTIWEGNNVVADFSLFHLDF